MKDVFHVDIILCKDGMLIHNLFKTSQIIRPAKRWEKVKLAKQK